MLSCHLVRRTIEIFLFPNLAQIVNSYLDSIVDVLGTGSQTSIVLTNGSWIFETNSHLDVKGESLPKMQFIEGWKAVPRWYNAWYMQKEQNLASFLTGKNFCRPDDDGVLFVSCQRECMVLKPNGICQDGRNIKIDGFDVFECKNIHAMAWRVMDLHMRNFLVLGDDGTLNVFYISIKKGPDYQNGYVMKEKLYFDSLHSSEHGFIIVKNGIASLIALDGSRSEIKFPKTESELKKLVYCDEKYYALLRNNRVFCLSCNRIELVKTDIEDIFATPYDLLLLNFSGEVWVKTPNTEFPLINLLK